MKKRLLLFTILMMSAISANAANWMPVQTDKADLSVYVDVDSIQAINDYEYLYAIRYFESNKPQKVAYIKSDYYNNLTGIIRAEEYSEEAYKPGKIFANPHAYMKPLKETSFLSSVNNDVMKIADINPSTDINIVKVAYTGVNSISAYKNSLAEKFVKNWNPPKTARNRQAKVILTIGKDGSLQKYRFSKLSGDETTDRSIISAFENNAPYVKLPKNCENNIELQFTFNYGLFKKYVY